MIAFFRRPSREANRKQGEEVDGDQLPGMILGFGPVDGVVKDETATVYHWQVRAG